MLVIFTTKHHWDLKQENHMPKSNSVLLSLDIKYIDN